MQRSNWSCVPLYCIIFPGFCHVLANLGIGCPQPCKDPIIGVFGQADLHCALPCRLSKAPATHVLPEHTRWSFLLDRKSLERVRRRVGAKCAIARERR